MSRLAYVAAEEMERIITRRRTSICLAIVVLAMFMSVAPSEVGASASGLTPIAHEQRCRPHQPTRCGTVRVPLDRSGHVQGTLDIGYRRYPRTDRSQPALETIVAVEGGPGYATTASASWYRDLFQPLMDRHDLLLVDLRGTGTSEPLLCERLQRIRPPYTDWVEAVRDCGAQLGDASNLYGTAPAADDLASVMDALGLDQVDLYGDSYGTFFSQVFAIRHPDRVRTLMLDAAYPVEGADPWWRDLPRAAVSGYRLACQRDPGCSALPGDPIARLRKLDRRVAVNPITGRAPDANGHMGTATIDPAALIQILDAGGYAFDPYRELDAAVRAATGPFPDNRPLLRLAREEIVGGSGGPVDLYSQGLAVATECTDYPQLYPMDAPPSERPAAYQAAIDDLKLNDPNAFTPFTVQEYVTSPDEDYDTCIGWPVAAFPHRLLPKDAVYPDVPTLVLVGDLDSVTSAEGAQQVADHFPNSTYVEVPNMVHVSALGDITGCAAGIVVHFVRSLDAGDTSCVAGYPEVRTVDAFTRRLDGLPGTRSEKAALAALDTVADVIARWDSMGGWNGVGLRGGTFTTKGYGHRSWDLDDVRWLIDIGVSGSVSLDAQTGEARATVTLTGRPLAGWHVRLRWNALTPQAIVTVHGSHDGVTFETTLPAA